MSETKSSGKRLSAEDVKGKFQEDLAFADYCHLPAAQWPPSREGLKKAAKLATQVIDEDAPTLDEIAAEAFANVSKEDWLRLPRYRHDADDHEDAE